MKTIDSLLDKNGKGVLTEEMRRIFVGAGCQPACHICGKGIKVGERLHLKPFFMRSSKEALLSGEAADIVDRAGLDDETEIPQVHSGGKTTSSIDVMICEACSKANKRLPRNEANKLLATAYLHGMIKDAPGPMTNAGTVAGPPRYRYSSQAFRGGCMVIRASGKPSKIIA
jgi:hypothetical protein